VANEPTQLQTAFGEHLRQFRHNTGLSQEQLALNSGLDRTYISLLERGLRQPTLTTLFTLASSLGIKPSSLVQSVEDALSR